MLSLTAVLPESGTPPAEAKTAETKQEVKANEPVIQKKKKVKHIIKDEDKNNPGIKTVLSMLEGFSKMGDNKQEYVNKKYDYAQYKKVEAGIAREISANIDFYDVCEKSLKYEYDPAKKVFLKDHWRGKSNSDKTAFVALFRQLIEDIVYPIANDFFGDLKIEDKVVENKPDYIHVKSTIHYKKKNVITEWYLHKKGENWKIFDIGVEGERWVISFRSQFTDIITKKSYQELIKLMNKKLTEVKEDNERKDKNARNGIKEEKKSK
ncbi:MAG: ABC transporter substrate-binding protein [Oligoflexia bacterium]|nr:ABC transporter substrate-binding protein [Oligoflexia bacterium]